MNSKIVLCGEAGVGKSAYMNRLTGVWQPKYVATLGLETWQYNANAEHISAEGTTCNEHFTFDVYDLAGQNKFAGPVEDLMKEADAVIVMFDVTNRESARNVGKWIDLAQSNAPGAPIFLVANKIDLHTRRVTQRNLSNYVSAEHLAALTDTIELSVRSCYNFDKPFLSIARHLTGNELKFTYW